MDKNIRFLLGHEFDDNGLTVQQYLQFDENDWETQHDVIQLAFPTMTQSKFHPHQPFLPASFDISNLTDDERQRVKATVSLLLHSYMNSLGVEFLINQTLVTFTMKQHIQTPAWASSRDHNTLRLTRILECLGILGMGNIQTALHDFLVYDIGVKYSGAISAKTIAFWVAARENKLHLIR